MFKKYLLLIIIAISHNVIAHESHDNDPVQDMVSAANNFISSLSKEQKSVFYTLLKVLSKNIE